MCPRSTLARIGGFLAECSAERRAAVDRKRQLVRWVRDAAGRTDKLSEGGRATSRLERLRPGSLDRRIVVLKIAAALGIQLAVDGARRDTQELRRQPLVATRVLEC